MNTSEDLAVRAAELRAKLQAYHAENERLQKALKACVEWMEFTIEQLQTHDKGARLNWAGPLSKARACLPEKLPFY